MSDYIYKKAIRTKCTAELLEKFKVDDSFNLVDEAYNRLITNSIYEEMCEKERKQVGLNYFTSDFDEDNYYIDFILAITYGEECGEYGAVSKLTDEEYLKYLKEFNEFFGYEENHMLNLCLVEYCYYNCTESDTYYEEYDYDYSNLKWFILGKETCLFNNEETFNNEEIEILNKVFKNPNLYQFTVDNDCISVRELTEEDFDAEAEVSEEIIATCLDYTFTMRPEQFLVKFINYKKGHAISA